MGDSALRTYIFPRCAAPERIVERVGWRSFPLAPGAMDERTRPDRYVHEFAPRELLTRCFGWQVVDSPPFSVTTPTGHHLLRPLAVAGSRAAYLHETPLGRRLPDHATRRAVRSALGCGAADALIVFTDVLRTAQVWQWTHQRRNGVLISRERGYLSGASAEPLLQALSRADAFAADSSGASEASVGAAVEQVSRLLLPALLRGVRRRCSGATRQRLDDSDDAARRGELREIQELVEGSTERPLLRAFWRSLHELRVLDAACGRGDHLLAVLQVLEPLYEACLERMRCWVAEHDRARPARRPEATADFRLAIRRADADAEGGQSRWIRRSALRLNVYGVDLDAAAVGACRARLLRELRTGDGTDARRSRDEINLACGDLRLGFADRSALRDALAPLADPATELDRLEQEAEILYRAERLQRGNTAPGLGGGSGDPELRKRRARLRSGLDALAARREGMASSDPRAVREWARAYRPVHAWAEYYAVLAEGGFDLVLNAPPGFELPRQLQPATERVQRTGRPRRSWRGPEQPPNTRLSLRASAAGIRQGAPSGDTPVPAPPASDSFERLGPGGPRVLTLHGAAELLDSPAVGFFSSVHVPTSVVLRTLDLMARVPAGTPVIGGFHSPLEAEVLELLLRRHQSIIVAMAREIVTMRIPSGWTAALEGRRMLLVSAAAAKVRRATSRTADDRNLLVGELAAGVFIAHAAPGSRTYRLARALLGEGKPVWTHDVAANADLLLLGARRGNPWRGGRRIEAASPNRVLR